MDICKTDIKTIIRLLDKSAEIIENTVLSLVKVTKRGNAGK